MAWEGVVMTNQGTGESRDSSIEDDRIEVMLHLYAHLRDEILVSIQFQNRVILGEAVVVGLIYGIRLTDNPERGAVASSLVELAAIILPPVIIVSTALWTVEQTRMMRIGDYLELLENRINEELGSPCITWENWLRSGNVSHVGNVHHTAKTMGYVGFFLVLGLLGLLLYMNEFMVTTSGFYILPYPDKLQWSPRVSTVFAVYIIFFAITLLMTLPIITYRKSLISSVLKKTFPSGQQWSFTPSEDDSTATDSTPEDETVTNYGSEREDATVADGGSESDEGSASGNRTDEDEMTDKDGVPKWGQDYQMFKKWESCYQVDVLRLDSEDTERPSDVEITKCTGMVSALKNRIREK